MQKTKDEKRLTEILTRPLPKDALKKHPSRSYLTTINPIYVTDRLNEAFGVGGWNFNPEIIDDDTNPKMVIIRGTLTADKHSIKVVQFGGNDNDDRGDAYKGASTDALTKCASYLGIGAEVWRNGKPAEMVVSEDDEKDIKASFRKRFLANKGLTLPMLNGWLRDKNLVEEKQVYTSLKVEQVRDFERNWDSFIKNVRNHNGTPSDKTTE
tara:strand:- start:51 stop:680 length:630 start_codon:yes stop_codon:yes gene_type:complete